MMQQWPFGANILVESVSCNFNENIDVGDADFMTSLIKDTEMTFKYTEINGTLVEIDTNLEVVNFYKEEYEENIGYFTLRTNKANNYPPEGEKPYINLCCNDVKLPIAFINFTDSGNKWFQTDHNEDDNTLTVYTSDEDYVIIPATISVSWNKSSTTKLFLKKEVYSSQEYYIFKVHCLRKTDTGQIEELILSLYDKSGTPKEAKNILTIPKLDGKESNILSYDDTKYNLNFYQYFILGAEIRLRNGDSVYQPETTYYVSSNLQKKLIRYYDNTTFPYFIQGLFYLKSEKGFPTLNTELSTKWNTSFFFLTEKTDNNKNNYYISPSTSQIFWKYTASGECSPYCDCDGVYTCSHGCNKCDPHCPNECPNECPTNCPEKCTVFEEKPDYCDLCFDECYNNTSTKNCKCNFVCNEYEYNEHFNYDDELFNFECTKFWGCAENGKFDCVMNIEDSGTCAAEECGCNGFCIINNNSLSDDKCFEYYLCKDYYSDTMEVDADCYHYYDFCKKHETNPKCGGFCECFEDTYCSCDAECTCDGTLACTSETGPGPTPGTQIYCPKQNATKVIKDGYGNFYSANAVIVVPAGYYSVVGYINEGLDDNGNPIIGNYPVISVGGEYAGYINYTK